MKRILKDEGCEHRITYSVAIRQMREIMRELEMKTYGKIMTEI